MVSRTTCIVALAGLGLAACGRSGSVGGGVFDAGEACENDSECDGGRSDASALDDDAGHTSGFVPRFPAYCAQGQIHGDVAVSTPESLDALKEARCIDGDLLVTGPEVVSLDALAQLRLIAGNFVLANASALKTFDGLDNLEKIEGDLIVDGMLGVPYQAPFEQLTSVGGDLRIAGVQALQELAGFPALTRIGGSLLVWQPLSGFSAAFSALNWVGSDVSFGGETTLTQFDGLNALTFVGGSLFVGGVTRLTGFKKLETVAGSMYLPSELTTLGEFASLREVGSLYLSLTTMREYEGFQNLTRASSSLSVSGPELNYLNAFANLRSAGKLELTDLLKLRKLTGFSKLENSGDLTLAHTGLVQLPFTSLTTAAKVTLTNNPWLLDAEGLHSLTSFTSLFVQNNADLQTLAALAGPADLIELWIAGNTNLYDVGLTNLQNIQRSLAVFANPSLSRCEADRLVGLVRFPKTDVGISSNLGCAQCDGRTCATAPSVADGQRTYMRVVPADLELSSLRNVQTAEFFGLVEWVGEPAPLPNLTKIDRLYLVDTSLRDLSMLEALEEITGSLEIHGNEQLESLSGMIKLRTVGSTFEVVGNPKLSELGLDALESVGWGITFRGDAELSVCQVKALEDQLGGEPTATFFELKECSGICAEGVCQ